jgi:hypothetical protein
MVLPGWKSFLFFSIMAVVMGIKQWTGAEIPPEIAEKLTEEEIRQLAEKGQYIVNWITIVGGYFFRAITTSPIFKK